MSDEVSEGLAVDPGGFGGACQRKVPGIETKWVAQPSRVHLVSPFAHGHKSKRSARVGRPVEVGGSVAGSYTAQMRMASPSNRPLRKSVVRLPDHANVAVAPRSARDPVECVPTIGGLVDDRVPSPLRSVFAAHVLDHAGVTLTRPICPARVHERVVIFAVRLPNEDGRQRLRRICRMKYVSRQSDAVTHAHNHIALDASPRKTIGRTCRSYSVGNDEPASVRLTGPGLQPSRLGDSPPPDISPSRAWSDRGAGPCS